MVMSPSEDFDKDDPRSVSTARFDVLVDQINALTAVIEKQIIQESERKLGPVQEVLITQRTEGMGAWGVAAVTACFFTVLCLILFAIWVVPAVHDLQAYSQQHSDRLGKLEKKP